MDLWVKRACWRIILALYKNSIFINKNNWKLVLIITFRNRRMRKFCKKRRVQLYHIFMRETEKLQDSIKKCCFQQLIPPPKMRSRISQKPLHLLILLFFIFFKMKNVSCFMFHTLEGVKQNFDLLFLERRTCERRSFLQKLASRRFCKVMIKTSFQLFY